MEDCDARLLSCSSTHTVAIGHYGHVYVWGENTFDKEEFDEDQSESTELRTSSLSYKLGFSESDIKSLEKPAFFSLQHPLYKAKATQVSCGNNFTAIIGTKKTLENDEDDDETIFNYEIDDRLNLNLNEFQSADIPFDKEKCEKIYLANKIRRGLSDYLKNNNTDFKGLFKSSLIKEESFISILKNIVNLSVPTNKIKEFIEYKKMKLPGKGVILTPLYDLITKCKQGKGFLYILGQKNYIIPKFQNTYLATTLRHQNLTYFLIDLPESISCAKVSCGDDFVIILSHKGFLYSWGSRACAALGRNRGPTYLTIKPIQERWNEQFTIKDIVCGSRHCLALSTTGILFTWGDGESGALGNGRKDNVARPESIDVQGYEIVMIKAGHNSSFCKTSDSTCFAWGDVSNKKFGVNTKPINLKPNPIHFANNEDSEIYDVAIGLNCCTVIDKYWHLGSFTVVNKEVSNDTKVTKISKFNNLEGIEFYQVVAKGINFFALSTKGSIYSWTQTQNRPVEGIPGVQNEISSCSQHFQWKDAEESSDEENPVRKECSEKVKNVSCSEENTLLITDKGEIVLCGSNKLGQAGIIQGDLEENSNDDYFPEFVIVPRLSMIYKVCITSVACGSHHILAINSDMKVLAWGANSYGQLGIGTFSYFEKSPQMIKSLKDTKVEMVSAGRSHSMILSKEKKVYSFGSAEHGKLGVGYLKPTIMNSNPIEIKELSNIFHIDCGDSHSLAIRTDKVLFTWGQGWNGQLGFGTKETCYEPRLLLSTIQWQYAACGSSHTIAISTENRVYQWGEIFMEDEELELLIPNQVKVLKDTPIKKVYASDGYSAALTENGSALYTWGKQYSKRIINSDLEDKKISQIVKLNLPLNEKIVDLSINIHHGALLTEQGKVYTWGSTLDGRTGDIEAMEKGKTKAYSQVDLSEIIKKPNNHNEKPEEFFHDLQTLLQHESEELNETKIREIDTQIVAKFDSCINTFIEIASQDSSQELFFNKVEYKQLSRLTQEPFRCQLSKTNVMSPEIEKKIQGYSSLVTSYIVHPCYMYKLFDLKIKEEKKLEMLNLIYTDMEKDRRLIFTAIYLAKKLLKKNLDNSGPDFKAFLASPDNKIYFELLLKIISASEEDMAKIIDLGETAIRNLSVVVHDDEHGIDPDPLTVQKMQNSNKISAYQLSKFFVDRRMNKLIQTMRAFRISLEKIQKEGFSEIIYLIVKEFLDQCDSKFQLNLKNLDPLNYHIESILGSVFKIVFKPLCLALENPYKYCLLVEASFSKIEFNLKSLSNTIKAFFSGNELGEPNERWFADVNSFNKSEENLLVKISLLKKILNRKEDLEELYTNSVFVDSLSASDKSITVSANSMRSLHYLTDANLDSLRVSGPTFDPLSILLKLIHPVPPSKTFSKNDMMNLNLYTRSLRQDQSIVRCPDCEILIPRDMAPNNFKPVIVLYDPMPPNSPTYILTQILATGPKKQKKDIIYDYIENYRKNYFCILKDIEVNEKIKSLINSIDISNSAKLDIGVDGKDPEEKKQIEENREISLKMIEKECEKEYRRRKSHSLVQKKFCNILDKLFGVLESMKKNSVLDEDKKKAILFNIEYGASNLELERFSDSVMFSIFMNKIREYTSKKDMSINLFENLTDKMRESLRGFMKRSLKQLIKMGTVRECSIPAEYRANDILFSFEIDSSTFIIMVTNSPRKFNICGRDEYCEEELLLHHKIKEETIADIREECKTKEKINE